MLVKPKDMVVDTTHPLIMLIGPADQRFRQDTHDVLGSAGRTEKAGGWMGGFSTLSWN